MRHRAAILAVIVVVVAVGGCRAADPARNAPLDCLHKAKQDSRLDLKTDYLVQLCSGATNADARIECYVAARADAGLGLNTNGALMLCSPFNLDAFSAHNRSCPSVETSGIEARLGQIERRLADVAGHR